jgi:membrane-bound lytic murein transglycosylase D
VVDATASTDSRRFHFGASRRYLGANTMTRPSLAAAVLAALLPVAARAAPSALEEAPGLAEIPQLGLATLEVPLAPPAACVVDEPAAAETATATAEATAIEADAPAVEAAPAAAAAAAETEDDPAVKEEVDAESRELEDVEKAAEAAGVGEVTAPTVATPEGHGDDERIPLLPELDHGLAKLQSEYDIPIDVNDAVAQWVRFFQNPVMRKHFAKWLSRYYRYEARYRAILKENGLPEDTIFLAMIESGFANFAYSRARASGPWQFIGPTGRTFGLKQDFWVDERRDPEKAANAAARYLKLLREQTGDWRLAWAGYNAGVGRIYRAQAKGVSDFWEMTKGRLLRKETKGYVPKLMAAAIVTKHREAFGFDDAAVEKLSWVETDEVQLNGSVLLDVVARAAGVDKRDLMELNPELRRAVTPPRPFTLKLPRGSAATFAQNWPALEGKARANFAGHVVRRGDTLGAIALRFGTQVEGIMQLNGLSSTRRLRIGQELLIPVARGQRAEEVAAKPQPARPASIAASPASPKLAGTPIMDPAGFRPPAAPINGTRHVVQDGDTLWSISQRLGVDLDTLCRWNNIRNPRRFTLKIGTELVVKPQGG